MRSVKCFHCDFPPTLASCIECSRPTGQARISSCFSVASFLHDDRLPAQLLLAEDDHIAGTLPVRRLHLPLHFPVQISRSAEHPARRNSASSEIARFPGLFTQGHHVTVEPAPDRELNPLSFRATRIRSSPKQSRCPGHPRRRSPPPVRCTGRPRRGFRPGPQPFQDIFKGGLGVIVQSPHQSGVDPVREFPTDPESLSPPQSGGRIHRTRNRMIFGASSVNLLQLSSLQSNMRSGFRSSLDWHPCTAPPGAGLKKAISFSR